VPLSLPYLQPSYCQDLQPRRHPSHQQHRNPIRRPSRQRQDPETTMDTKEEPLGQQGCSLPPEPLRQGPPQTGTTYVPPWPPLAQYSFPMPSPPSAKREKGKEIGVSCWRGVPHYPFRSLKSFLRYYAVVFVFRLKARMSYVHLCHALEIRVGYPSMSTGALEISRTNINIWYKTVRRLILRT